MKPKLLIDKFKTKQFGALLIMIGIFIPLIMYLYTTETTNALLMRAVYAQARLAYPGTGVNGLEIVLVKAEHKAAPKKVVTSEELSKYNRGRIVPLKDIVFDDETDVVLDKKAIAIPYKYPLSFGMLLVFAGGCLVVFGKKGNVIYL